MCKYIRIIITAVCILLACRKNTGPLDFVKAEYIDTWYVSQMQPVTDQAYTQSITYTLIADSFYYRCNYLLNSFTDTIPLKESDADSGIWQLDEGAITFQGTGDKHTYKAELTPSKDTLLLRDEEGKSQTLVRGKI